MKALIFSLLLGGLAVAESQAQPQLHLYEQLYAVQNRHNQLDSRLELSTGAGLQLAGEDYIRSSQLEVQLRYYFDSRWFASVEGAYVGNSISSSGQKLYDLHQIIPDSPYVTHRVSAQAGFNLLYGKFRVTPDTVFYFDQFLSLGAGWIQLNTGAAIAATADLGVAAWFTDSLSLRLGVRDYFYSQPSPSSSSMVHDVLAFAQIGVLL